jgi:hypothetical protein
MLRRTEPTAVTVWLALQAARTVTLRIYGRNAQGELVPQFEGTGHTVRLGDHLHLAAVTARAAHDHERLAWGALYYYNLFFQPDGAPGRRAPQAPGDLDTPGILTLDPPADTLLRRLRYPGHPLPSFVLPPQDLNQLKILHGSCRKPHGLGTEMLSAIDAMIERAAGDPADRPQQLIMTGDQIYGDDGAAPLLFALIDAGTCLLDGNTEEVLPLVGRPARLLAPGTRGEIVRHKALLTTATPHSHLLSFAEYATMYLFAWSDVLWPDDVPRAEDVWTVYPDARPRPELLQKGVSAYADQRARLKDFRSTLPQVRRALANVPTYTICDDHDVTDDWFLDGAWCRRVLASPLGRRVIRNALLAYALFQAWGNTPDQFDAPPGRALLAAVEAWGREPAETHEETIAEILGLPASFDGRGTLLRGTRALRWNYTVAGPRYQLIVLDTRTERLYGSPTAFPALLAPGAMERQLVAARREDAETTLIVSAPPVLGMSFVEALQFWSRLRIKNNYALDREAWNLEWGTFQKLLSTVSAMKRVVFLSGDVHYGFGASLDYWDHARSATAKIVNYTSSPLRNEGSSSQMAMLAVGYPYLAQLLRHASMPAADFFAWDVNGKRRDLLGKLRAIIRARILLFWWAAPRLIDVLRSPSEIVLPAKGWPTGVFDAMPPDRSYRLRYLRDRARPVPGQMAGREPEHGPRLSRANVQRSLSGIVLGVVAFAQTRLEQARRGLVRRTLVGAQAPARLPRGTRHIARGTIKGAELLEGRLEKRKHSLMQKIFHREDWLSQWKAGAYIVGYANIGEIRFHWTPDAKEVVQRLWWRHSDEPRHPTLVTEYRDTLEPPSPDVAPPLP